MSRELLFELIEKSKWSYNKRVPSTNENQSWFFSNTFRKWFNPPIKLSLNAERFLQETGKNASPVSLHLPSNRLALIINNNICIISLLTSAVVLEIPLDFSRSEKENNLNCLAWSNNGRFLAYGHWSGTVCVYSADDGQLLHKLSTKSLNRDEDSFLEIWFSGSDASPFIDLLCLKRNGAFIRYAMIHDNIASCVKETFPFHISCAIVHPSENRIYLVPFNTQSIEVWKIVQRNPSIVKQKEYLQENQENYIYGLALSPDGSYLVSVLSNQSVVLYENSENLRYLATLKGTDNRSPICDFSYWNDQTLVLFYDDGSMSFHNGTATLEGYHYKSGELNQWPRLCDRGSSALYLIDSRIIERTESEEEDTNIISRLIRPTEDATVTMEERLILIEHGDPDRMIDSLLNNKEYGEALRVAGALNRNDLADRIREKRVRSSSEQMQGDLSRIQSRLHVLQLSTDISYPTYEEQLQLINFGLQQATKEKLFKELYYTDQGFARSIERENSDLKDMPRKVTPLNFLQKQLLLYRRKLLDGKRKLYLYEDLIEKHHAFENYQSNVFHKFRDWDYKQIALRCARKGHLDGLKLILDTAIPSLSSSDLLTVFNELPETISLSKYVELLPKFSPHEEKTKINQLENDWSDEFVSPSEENSEKLDRAFFVRWYHDKISSFESFGYIDNALQLCQHALEVEGFQELASLFNTLSLEHLLNEFSDQDLTFKQMQEMSDETLLDLIITFKSDSTLEDINRRLERVLIPSMKFLSQSHQLLKKVLIEKLQHGFDIYPIVSSLKSKGIFQQRQFDLLIKDLILNVNSTNQISLCQQLLSLSNDKQDFDSIIESCRIFLKWSVRMIPSDIIRIQESEESLSNAIVLLIQSAIREGMNKINLSTGNELYHDIEQISRHRLSSQSLSNLYVLNLLKSDSMEWIQMARTNLSRSHFQLVIQAARDYIDSARNGQDKSILLAKNCLDLIDDPSLVINERNLIESQNLCDYFQYSITPLEIRRHPNPMQIIPAILNSNPQAYKNTSKLTSLALRLQTGNKQEKKDQCLLYIAEYCLKITDLNMCWELCSLLIGDNYAPSWKCCWALINQNSAYINPLVLSFISLHCDKLLLEDVLKKSLVDRDQSIPQEEYRITSTYSHYLNSFYDRDYSQQMNFKELPLLQSPPISERSALKYVNIDTSLFIMVYLASNTKNDVLIEKDNEYALQLSIYCQSLMKSPIPRNYKAIPSSIIDKSFLENNANYESLLENRQYSVLNQLDQSIDLNRFKLDFEYRRLTILGLFMCDNPSFDYAEQLAIKYNISIDECHHSYFEHLLTSSELSLNEIRRKIKPFLNSERIKKNRQIKLDLVKRLHSNVFPLIDGRDYERLKLFYDIKKSLGDSTHAQKHIQAIQQLTTILKQNFDYKSFLASPGSFIEQYGNDSNIVNLGLAFDQVKISSSFVITPSWVYSYYLQFHPSSSLILDLIPRVTSFDEFDLLLQHLISARDSLSIDQRIQIIDFSRQLVLSKGDQQWKTLEDLLDKHLRKLRIFTKLSSSYSEEELNQLDQAGTVEEQEETLATIASEHGQFDLISYLKTDLFDEISIYHILHLTIEKISHQIKSGDENSHSLLNTLLESISLDTIDKKEFFSTLQQMCRSETIDRRVRYQLIDKLDKMFDKQALQSDDLLLFEQYHLSNLLASFDSFTEIKKEDIQSDEKRCELFQKYLSQAKKNIHFESLIQILNHTWSKEQLNRMKGSHGLTLKNELIRTMIENESQWERILTENVIQFDEEEMNSLIKYFHQTKDLTSYAYKLWLIHPISSLNDLLFRSLSEGVIDQKFLRISIERNRVGDLLRINSSLFDYYFNGNLSNEEKSRVLKQLENNEDFLFQLAQLFLHKEECSSLISFGLMIDVLQKYFLK